MLTYDYYSQLDAHHDSKDQALASHGAVDQWKFTPSMFDANPSFSLGTFNNQPTGYYTPTPGGLNTVYHNQTAGDLHTPGMAFHLGTPLSMPMHDGSLSGPTSTFEMQGFNPQIFQTHQYPTHQQFTDHSTAFPPSMLVHQDSGYGPMEGSPDDELDINATLPTDSQLASPVTQRGHAGMGAHLLPSFEKWVYYIPNFPPSTNWLQVSVAHHLECANGDDQTPRRDSNDIPEQGPSLHGVHR